FLFFCAIIMLRDVQFALLSYQSRKTRTTSLWRPRMFSEITLTNAMRAMFTLTGLILVMLVFSGPAGFVGLPMILLPALSGIMVGIARALESGDMVRFWFTVAS